MSSAGTLVVAATELSKVMPPVHEIENIDIVPPCALVV